MLAAEDAMSSIGRVLAGTWLWFFVTWKNHGNLWMLVRVINYTVDGQAFTPLRIKVCKFPTSGIL